MHAVSSYQDLLAKRLNGQRAIRIASSGLLTEPQDGQTSGTPYVVIEADNAMNRDIARHLLSEHSSTTDLAWDHGWTLTPTVPCGRPNARIMALTLYAP